LKSRKRDLIFHSTVSASSFETIPIGAVSDNDGLDAREIVPQKSDSLYQQVESFYGGKTGDADQVPSFFCVRGCRRV
jgi:hypothetical protein